LTRKRRLTEDQEHQRLDGLRILARIIARHYLAHPEMYPQPVDAADDHAVESGNAQGQEDAA